MCPKTPKLKFNMDILKKNVNKEIRSSLIENLFKKIDQHIYNNPREAKNANTFFCRRKYVKCK